MNGRLKIPLRHWLERRWLVFEENTPARLLCYERAGIKETICGIVYMLMGIAFFAIIPIELFRGHIMLAIFLALPIGLLHIFLGGVVAISPKGISDRFGKSNCNRMGNSRVSSSKGKF